MQPLISVIVPVYNAEQCIGKCVESIQSQTYENLEIILVDDCSTDNSLKLCKQYASKDPRLKIVEHPKNQGVSAARNSGIEISRGMYIAFVDSDDYLAPNAYECMVQAIDADDISQVVCNAYNVQDGKLTETAHYYGDGLVEGQDVIAELAKPLAFSGGTDKRVRMLAVPWNRLYLRDIIIENNVCFEAGVDFGEDMLFNINFYRFAKRVKFINKILYYHNIVSNSLSGSYREKRFQQASTAFHYYHEWFPEDFDEQKYHSAIVALNRNCIKYGAEQKGFSGVKKYLASTKNFQAVLDASYQYIYSNVFLRGLIRRSEVRLAVKPLMKHYAKKILRRK